MPVISLGLERLKRMLRKVDPSLTDEQLDAFVVQISRRIRTAEGKAFIGPGS